ncbi:MAG: sugar O-acetyltransferase [Phycisphaerae bacterium]
MTEKQKMLAGQLYDASETQLSAERRTARLLLGQLNQSNEDQQDLRRDLLGKLLPHAAEIPWIEPPFYCDYGSNIHMGQKVYFNFNCVVLDVCKVTIGSRVLFGPAVQIYAATHPIDAATRATGLENGKDVSIGSDVWVGGGAIICPGVTIGDRSVVAAGAVVVKDVPPDVVVGGNPARLIKQLA